MATAARPRVGLLIVPALLAGPLPGQIGPGIKLAPRHGKPLADRVAPAQTLSA